MEREQNLLSADLQIDNVSVIHLRETAKWAKFLGILGIIFSVLIGICGLFATSMLTAFKNATNQPGPVIGGAFISVFYIVGAGIYFFLSLYTMHFGSKMQSALQVTDQSTLNESFLNLKRVFRMMGIIAIVYLSIIALCIIVAVAAIGMR